MNVLSLFDGISCGQIALERAGIKIDNYFASEIESASIEVTIKNYPKTRQIGNVMNVNSENLPKIDLLIGGSPCQGFSFAGKQLNFEDPRSKLFFEYIRLLEKCSPKYFLLENVRMKKEHELLISKCLGIEPVSINSSKITAHDRKRLYWTNISDISNIAQLEDSGIYLKDVLDKKIDCGLYLKNEIANRYIATQNYIPNPKKSCVIGKLSKYQGDRVFDVNCKASSLSASGGNNGGGGCNIIHDIETNKLRRLSVTECEKLQGVPIGYTKGFKPSLIYKALGNGWTVDVITHIFKKL